MIPEKHIFTVDTHTMGEPTRVIISGFGPLPPSSIPLKRDYIKKEYDHIRTALLHEPRGHKDMFGSIILDSNDPKANLGVVFMDSNGYLNMCVHGTIGTVTAALEMGIISPSLSEIIVDTPAGLVKVNIDIGNDRLIDITIQNVASFLYKSFEINVPNIGTITVDIAFGGNFFALVEEKDIRVRICHKNIDKLIGIGMSILKIVNENIKVSHPINSFISSIDLVEISGEPSTSLADEKNIVIFGRGQFDRSPCGTGTCARMAALFSKGKLSLLREFKNESIIGSIFNARLKEKTTVGNTPAVIPTITGSAHIIGFQHFVIRDNDPLKYGFLVDTFS
jgi:proline racemase